MRLSDLIQNGEADLQTGPFGMMLHASSYLTSGTPVIAVQHVGTGYLIDEEMPMIGLEDADVLRSRKW
jgi:type I restriction enzyme S subunit